MTEAPPVRTRKPRKFLYIMMAISIIALVIYTVLWMMGARGIKAAVDDFVVQQRANGMIVEHGAVRSTGFPFLLRTHIENVQMGQPDLWHWRSEALFIDALPYALDRMIFSAAGDQRLEVASLQTPYNIWTGNGDMVRASIAHNKDTQWAFVFQIEAASFLSDQGHAEISTRKLVVNVAPLKGELTTIGASLAADHVQWHMPISEENKNMPIDRLEIALDVSHTDQFKDENTLRQWAGEGGAVNLHRFVMSDLPAHLAANGAVTINSQGELTGAMTSVLQKPANFLTSLDMIGLVPADQKDAMTAALALSSLAGGGQIKTVFEFRDGQVLANGAPVADLPAIK